MLQIFDELLTKEQKKELQEEYGDLNFCTMVYDENAKVPIILDNKDGASVGEVHSEIKNSNLKIKIE